MPFLSHYGDVPDISQRISIPSLIFLILVPLIVLFRLVISFRQSKKLHAEDWLIIVSTIFAEAEGIILLMCSAAGFGKHQKDLTAPVVERTLELFMVAQITYKLTIAFTKLSILSFYQRMFSRYQAFTLACRTIGILVLSWTLAAFFATVFQCIPVKDAWLGIDDGGHKGTCINIEASWYANAVFNIVTDVTIVILPIWVVHNIQMHIKEKVALCALFALGLLVCMCSILRATTLSSSADKTDRTWDPVSSSAWSDCEVNVAIIGSCMPMIKGFITRALRPDPTKNSIRSGSDDTVMSTPERQASVFTGPPRRPLPVISSCSGPSTPTWHTRLYNILPSEHASVSEDSSPEIWRTVELGQTFESRRLSESPESRD